MASPVLLLDSAALYYRAFYSQPTSITRSDGTPVNAVRGFLDTVARFTHDVGARQVIAAWDYDWRPAWRVDLVPSYKAHRLAAEGENTSASASASPEAEPDELTAQVPMIEQCLAAVDIPIVGAVDHEADDVLATLAATLSGPVVVATGDRDLFALIDDARGVSVLYTGRGPATRVTGAEVREQYGIDPAQYIDMAVLRGDPSDGLPGVKGIGAKTAVTLLNDFGSLAGIQQAAADPASALRPRIRESLLDSVDYITAATAVVTPVTTLALPNVDGRGTRPTEVDAARIANLGAEWNIKASLGRLAAVMQAQATDE